MNNEFELFVNNKTKLNNNYSDSINIVNIMNELLANRKIPILNGYGLYTLFSYLNYNSSEDTNYLITKFFGYPEKDYYNIFFSSIINDSTLFNKNFIFYDKESDINNKTKHIQFIKIDESVNMLMKNVLKYEYIKKDKLVFLSELIIKPIFQYKLDDVVEIENNKHLQYKNIICNYYCNNANKIIELVCDNNLIFGINYGNVKNILNVSKRMKPFLFKTVHIPIFKIKCKLNLTNVLKDTELDAVLEHLNCDDLFDEINKIDKIIQYSLVDINENMQHEIRENTNVLTNNKKDKVDYFCASEGFDFYFKHIKTQTIILIGNDS